MVSNAAAFSFVQLLAEETNSGLLELPSFPDVALRIRDALQEEDCDLDDVVRLLNSEPALTARLLTVANSAMLSRGGSTVKDVRAAVNRLGLDMVRNSAISLAMEQLTRAKDFKAVRPLMRQLWRHSVQVAATSYALAKRTKIVSPDEALLAGLMHDIGKLYILTRADQFPEFLGDTDAFEEITEDWHASIGLSVLHSWEFDEPIRHAAGGHENFHDLDISNHPLTTVIAVANFLAQHEKSLNLEDLQPVHASALRSIGLDEHSCRQVLSEAQEEIQSLSSALSG